jgi:hypothetical protein
MDERRRPGEAGGARPAAWALAAVWVAVGMIVIGQIQLPRPARPAPPDRPAAVACWVVRIAARPASAPSLRRDLRTLRRAGLAASLRPGRRTGSRELVLLARSRAGARAARDRAVRLGLTRGTVHRATRAACRR